jgi:purine nucleosidase
MSQRVIPSASEIGQIRAPTHLVLVDTDIGDDIDDALALALVLRSSEISLQGVTTVFGDTGQRARLAAHLLHVFGRNDIPVAAGIELPLCLRHRPSGVPQAAILDDCMGSSSLSPLSGPELIVETALAHYGELTLLCLGPLTNVATALQLEPRLFMALRSIVMMGGTSGFPWPEWNVRSDAKAAQVVLAAGVPITMLGWNVTTRCQLRAQDVEQLHTHDSPQIRLLSQLLAVWQRHRPRWHPPLPYLHDPLTVAALCAPELFTLEEMTVRVPLHGPFKGFMIPRLMDGPLVHAASHIQAKQARAWVLTRLMANERYQAR